MRLLFNLFLTFAKIGLFTFGGGYAMISMIEYECVEKHKWISDDEMMNITVIAGSTPGPIAINCATYVGFKRKGFAGALASTIGIVLPSLVIIFVIAKVLDSFLEIKLVANAFQGIKLAVGILIVDAAVKMIKKMPKKALHIVFLIFGCAAMLAVNIFSLNFSALVIMLAAGVLSLFIFIVFENGRKAGEKR